MSDHEQQEPIPKNIVIKAPDHSATWYINLDPPPRPTSLNPNAVDHYFDQVIAKNWCMDEGFITRFDSFANGVITFKLLTDPRFRSEPFFTARYAAEEYKKQLRLLAGAVRFRCAQYRAPDLLGLRILDAGPKANPAAMDALHARIERGWCDLPEKPSRLLLGRL